MPPEWSRQQLFIHLVLNLKAVASTLLILLPYALLLSAIHSAQFSDFSQYFKSVTYFLHYAHLQRSVVSVGLVSGVVCTSQAQICHFIRRVVILTTGLWKKLISALILTESRPLKCLRSSSIQQLSAIHLTFYGLNIYII